MNDETLNRALDRVPRYMVEHVRRYLSEGVPPGGFLQAVFENNLHRAASLADKDNQASLHGWACVLDALPMNVWGSREKVDAHLKHHREILEAKA